MMKYGKIGYYHKTYYVATNVSHWWHLGHMYVYDPSIGEWVNNPLRVEGQLSYGPYCTTAFLSNVAYNHIEDVSRLEVVVMCGRLCNENCKAAS